MCAGVQRGQPQTLGGCAPLAPALAQPSLHALEWSERLLHSRSRSGGTVSLACLRLTPAITAMLFDRGAAAAAAAAAPLMCAPGRYSGGTWPSRHPSARAASARCGCGLGTSPALGGAGRYRGRSGWCPCTVRSAVMHARAYCRCIQLCTLPFHGRCMQLRTWRPRSLSRQDTLHPAHFAMRRSSAEPVCAHASPPPSIHTRMRRSSPAARTARAQLCCRCQAPA